MTHVLGPELPGGGAQTATLLSPGISTLHAAVSLAVKPVQVTWLLAVFSTSSSVLSVPHGDSVTAERNQRVGVKHAHKRVTLSGCFVCFHFPV